MSVPILISISILIITLIYIFLSPVYISVCFDKASPIKFNIKILFFNINISKPVNTFYSSKKVVPWRLVFDNLLIIKQIIIGILKYSISLLKNDKHTLNIHLQGAFESPDITGMAAGIVEAIKPILGSNVFVNCFPDMMSPSTTFSFKLRGSFRLYSIFAETILLLIRIPLLKIMKLSLKYIRGDYHVRTT